MSDGMEIITDICEKCGKSARYYYGASLGRYICDNCLESKSSINYTNLFLYALERIEKEKNIRDYMKAIEEAFKEIKLSEHYLFEEETE